MATAPITETMPLSLAERLKAYVELTKPRIATLILIISMSAFFLAEGSEPNWLLALYNLLATSTLAAGIFALNHVAEKDYDPLMRRTDGRPLPSGRLQPEQALFFGLAMTIASVILSVLALNMVATAIVVFTAASYLLVYTPLKRKTAHHTALGALSGATPPLLGWAAAQGTLDPRAWILFGILFFWQFPHFLSIDIMYREDYERAGMLVLPVVDKSGKKVAAEILGALAGLLVVSVLPIFTPLAGPGYGAVAAGLGIWFLADGVRAVRAGTRPAARRLLKTSVFYLPLLFIAMIVL